MHLNQNKQLSFRKLLTVLVVTIISAGGGLGLASTPALAAGTMQQLQTIRFSQEAQVSNQPLLVSMTALAAGTIRFTTNGAVPVAESMPYQAPIAINKSRL